ncbi:hypothetical protein LCGC14_1346300, partial [marine sediment metagenome]
LAGIADTGDATRIALSTGVGTNVLLTDLVQVGATNDLTDGLGISSVSAAGKGISVAPVASLTSSYSCVAAFASMTSDNNNRVFEGVSGNVTLNGAGHTGLFVYGLNFTAGGVGGATDTYSLIAAMRGRVSAIANTPAGAMTVTALTGIDLGFTIAQAQGTLAITTARGIWINDPGSAQVADYTGLQIDNEAAATGNVYGIYTDMVGTYAIFVDAGLSRFDGNGTDVFELPADATANGAAQVGRIPVSIGGGTQYLYYYGS